MRCPIQKRGRHLFVDQARFPLTGRPLWRLALVSFEEQTASQGGFCLPCFLRPLGGGKKNCEYCHCMARCGFGFFFRVIQLDRVVRAEGR